MSARKIVFGVLAVLIAGLIGGYFYIQYRLEQPEPCLHGGFAKVVWHTSQPISLHPIFNATRSKLCKDGDVLRPFDYYWKEKDVHSN